MSRAVGLAGPAARAVTALASAVTVGGMIATPLAQRGGPVRRALASVVVVGLSATTAARSADRWGLRRAGIALAATAAGTAAVEHVGTSTGRPFGRYEYTSALRPRVGGVPVIVPLAWFAMAVPAREAAHSALDARADRRVARIALGSAALTAWDLFLDPQMVGEGYWRWARRGVYRGIPISNYVGWFVTGLGVMAVLDRVLPLDAGESGATGTPVPPDPVLVGEYATMATMETLGFAAFFKDPVVALVGGLAMMPIAAASLRSFLPGAR